MKYIQNIPSLINIFTKQTLHAQQVLCMQFLRIVHQYYSCILPACGGPELCLCMRQPEIMAWLGKTGVQTTNCYSSCNGPSSLGTQRWGLFDWLFIRGLQKMLNLLWCMMVKILLHRVSIHQYPYRARKHVLLFTVFVFYTLTKTGLSIYLYFVCGFRHMCEG